MKAIGLLKEYMNIDFGCNTDEHQKECLEAIIELEDLKTRLADSPITKQEKPREVFQGHSNVTHHYTDSSPDLSTVMLISALASDSSSCDSYSSSSSDSSSSCGGD